MNFIYLLIDLFCGLEVGERAERGERGDGKKKKKERDNVIGREMPGD